MTSARTTTFIPYWPKMKIKLDGKSVCSVCGAPWKAYRGLDGDEPPQCSECGASPRDIHGVDECGEPMIEADVPAEGKA